MENIGIRGLSSESKGPQLIVETFFVPLLVITDVFTTSDAGAATLTSCRDLKRLILFPFQYD